MSISTTPEMQLPSSNLIALAEKDRSRDKGRDKDRDHKDDRRRSSSPKDKRRDDRRRSNSPKDKRRSSAHDKNSRGGGGVSSSILSFCALL